MRKTIALILAILLCAGTIYAVTTNAVTVRLYMMVANGDYNQDDS